MKTNVELGDKRYSVHSSPPVTYQHPHSSPSAVVTFLYNGNNIILLPSKRLQLTLILMKVCSPSPKNGDTKSY